MTGTELATYIRKKTRTNATTFTDAEIVAFLNPNKDEMAQRIVEVREDYFGIFQLRNLVADQRNYAFPNDLLSKMKYLEAKLDGTNWKRLVEIDIQNTDIVTNEEKIQSYFSDKQPCFEIFGGEIIIYSGSAIIAVTDGLKLWSIIFPADFATSDLSGSTDLSVPPTATSFGFPRQFHKLLADKVIIEWKEAQDKPVPLTQNEALWERRMMDSLDSVRQVNLDRPLETEAPYNDGSDY